jgi:hypothetical protein
MQTVVTLFLVNILINNLSGAVSRYTPELALGFHIGQVAVNRAFADFIAQRLGDSVRGQALVGMTREIFGQKLSLFCNIFRHIFTSICDSFAN